MCPARRPFASGAERCLPLSRTAASQLLGAPAQIWHGRVMEEDVVMRRAREVGFFGEKLFVDRRERRQGSYDVWYCRLSCDGILRSVEAASEYRSVPTKQGRQVVAVHEQAVPAAAHQKGHCRNQPRFTALTVGSL